jgi:probable O-glycosylation ligase (exosortase A-associated)
LAWTWLGLMNPHKMSWALRSYPLAQVVGIATIIGLVLTRERRSLPKTYETVMLVIVSLYFTLTTIFAWYPSVSWVQWDKVSKIILFTFITMMLIRGRDRIRGLLVTITISLGFYGVKGGIFGIATGGNYRVWGPPTTFIADNTALGLALCMLLPLLLTVGRYEQNKWIRRVYFAAFWLTIPAIMFTYSRGAVIGLLALAPFLLWRYRRAFLPLAAVFVLAGPMLVASIPQQWYARQESTMTYQEDYSAMQRIQAWGVATNVALDRPFLGAGFNFEYAGDTQRWLSYANFLGPWHNEERAAHSIYFQVLGQHGIAGFVVFMLLVWGTFFRLHRLARLEEEDPEHAWIGGYAKGIQLSMVPYFVAGAFLSLAYFDLVYTLVALSAVLHREYAELRLASAEEAVDQSAEAGSDTMVSGGR